MQEPARKRLRTGADGSFSTNYMRDRTFIANVSEFTTFWPKQREILDRLRLIESQQEAMRDQQQTMQRGLEHLRQDTEHLKGIFDRLKRLKGLPSEEAIRHGFISCFKRDILRSPTEEDHRYITRTGNRYAHYGDCYRDSHLYEPGGRTDFAAFIELYGLSPAVIREELDRKLSPDS